MLPSTGELEPLGNPRAGRLTVAAASIPNLRAASWLGTLILTALAALVLLQCQWMPHHDTAPAALPHHGAVAGSPLQRTDVAATAHDHIGRAALFACSAVDAVRDQLGAPAVLRMLWLVTLTLLAAYVAFVVVGQVLTRGPPPHTGPVAIVAGRILIHRFCVLRR
ncbi:hypothetical protein [Mycobacteroides franklinii]|uniref:hypothetical protein n=1 Tax=Mycobacteroides franklinii TaxID=948102 RepID=UPI0013E8ABCC